MLPPDSSAARMPFRGTRRLLAINSGSFTEGCSAGKAWSWSLLRVELSLEFSRFKRARRRLSSIESPSIKLARTVAEAIE